MKNKNCLTDGFNTLPLPSRLFPGGQQAWTIVADRALTRGLEDGAVFQLRRRSYPVFAAPTTVSATSASISSTTLVRGAQEISREVSLLCTVHRLPLLHLVEEVLEPLESGRFFLRTDTAI
ncbi:unnamed protein product [Protopolystoma xenopodis]|uniref:Uncharacterized protein n=1 Tax=Protopolystoma xenopodis TaxID=117903 RepID=A0A448WTZ6_9PLAT|nr:unnamed protein product [Protopolystoma xenopodis]